MVKIPERGVMLYGSYIGSREQIRSLEALLLPRENLFEIGIDFSEFLSYLLLNARLLDYGRAPARAVVHESQDLRALTCRFSFSPYLRSHLSFRTPQGS